jgi:crossover junction endodeoxyribonuclease RuvC
MKILGIDPGLARMGWGIISNPDISAATTAWGSVSTSSKDPLPKRLQVIHATLSSVVAEHRPEIAAVEEVFFSKNVRSAVALAHARGAAILSLAEAGVELFEYSPLQIKQSVVGYGRASKDQVAQMVARLLGLKDLPSSEHASDALATALCHAASLKRRRLVSQALGKR